MRRGVGVGAVQQKQALAARSAAMGEAVAADRARHVAEQVEAFKGHLERFARLHRAEINRDPEFRAAFARMTASIGVDPLASSKGFWGEALGLGDFYYELAIQVVDACLASRPVNGGLLAVGDLLARVRRMRGSGSGAAIGEDDVRQALRKLEALGGGYRIVTLGDGSRYVSSLHDELAPDGAAVLQAASAAGRPFVTVPELCGSKSGADGGARPLQLPGGARGWEPARAQRAVDGLVRDGLAWVDDQAPPAVPAAAADGGSGRRATRYYLPALWQGGQL